MWGGDLQIGDIHFSISASTTQLVEGLEKARGMIGNFVKSATTQIQNMGNAIKKSASEALSSMGGLGKMLGTALSNPAMAAATGVTLLVGSLVAAQHQASATIAELRGLSRQLESNITDVQRLSEAAKMAGIEDIATGVKTASMRLGQGKSTGELGKLGLDQNTLANMSPVQQFEEEGRAITRVYKSYAEQIAAATELWGKQGKALLDVFKSNRLETVDKLNTKYGTIITDADISKTGELKRASLEVAKAWEKVGLEIERATANMRVHVSKWLAKAIDSYRWLAQYSLTWSNPDKQEQVPWQKQWADRKKAEAENRERVKADVLTNFGEFNEDLSDKLEEIIDGKEEHSLLKKLQKFKDSGFINDEKYEEAKKKIEELVDTKKLLEDQKKLGEEAKKMAESVLTPIEKYQEYVEKLNSMGDLLTDDQKSRLLGVEWDKDFGKEEIKKKETNEVLKAQKDADPVELVQKYMTEYNKVKEANEKKIDLLTSIDKKLGRKIPDKPQTKYEVSDPIGAL
jgi:hypothetical protein